ncbi:MAG: alpha/beta hydrolase [Acidobacteria bacterium]|nr:alpha/beta hydrolase [Acidobacteriota bacterium]
MRLLLALAAFSLAAETPRLVQTAHFVKVKSSAPSMNGQMAQIYVREVAPLDMVLRKTAQNVVLFIHGAGTPAEVAFDVPHKDYSWMAFLARAGFDTFSMDMTGYGRSTRPFPMNDPCNLAVEQQTALFGKTCEPSHTGPVTTLDSDWNDIDAVVDYLRALRGVDKVKLVGWSLGGPRAGGYAAQNSGKVSHLVLLAPAYGGGGTRGCPADSLQLPVQGRLRFELGPATRLSRSVRTLRTGGRVGRHAGFGPCGRHMGQRRPARPQRCHEGLEPTGG